MKCAQGYRSSGVVGWLAGSVAASSGVIRCCRRPTGRGSLPRRLLCLPGCCSMDGFRIRISEQTYHSHPRAESHKSIFSTTTNYRVLDRYFGIGTPVRRRSPVDVSLQAGHRAGQDRQAPVGLVRLRGTIPSLLDRSFVRRSRA